MRLYHPEHGYHFETSNNVVAEFKANGWIEAPKGFQKTLNQPKEVEEVKPAKTLGLPQKQNWKA